MRLILAPIVSIWGFRFLGFGGSGFGVQGWFQVLFGWTFRSVFFFGREVRRERGVSSVGEHEAWFGKPHLSPPSLSLPVFFQSFDVEAFWEQFQEFTS